MIGKLPLALAFTFVACTAMASEPVCLPEKWTSRAQLYAASDPYVTMPVVELEDLAKKDHPRALNALGIRYGLGRGVPKDSKKSFEYYQRAARLGLPRAQANLSFMYQHGEGVEKDLVQAYEWALKSARAGHMEGQVAVGYLLGMGEGVKMDRREAAFCYLLAARQGHGEAQEVMSTIYREGLGIPKNAREAALWSERSRQSHETATPWYEDTPLTAMPAAWGKAN